MSLRMFHLLFILLAILGADIFGVWCVWQFTLTHDPLTLVLGIVAILGGVGLIFYVVRLVKSLDAAKIH